MREIELNWEITRSCNLRCKHCIVSATNKINDEVSTEEVIHFLKKLDGYKVSINFTGGEPFYRKDFRKILEYCISQNIEVQIITNGLCFQKDDFALFKKNSISLGISVESFQKEHFEFLRGKNTYQKVMNNLELLSKEKIHFDIYTTFHKYNVNEIEEILINAKKYHAKVHFNDITVDGRAKNNMDILPSSSEIIESITHASQKVFGIDELYYDDSCWSNNDSLFISSTGNIYFCTELNRCNPATRIGNIRTFPIDEYYKHCPTIDYMNEELKCPYKVYFNDYITYNANCDEKCSLLPKPKKIKTLASLYQAFDELFEGIENSCKNCTYKDCMGFIWLLEKEKRLCDKHNITTININDEVDFLYFLKDYEDYPIESLNFTDIKYPKCEHRCEQTGKCVIHNLRPLVCHMYPVGLETSENKVDMWVLHDECAYTQYLIKTKKLVLFIQQLNNIISNIDKRLYQEIVAKYRSVDNISLFLNGINSYIIIKEVDDDVKM